MTTTLSVRLDTDTKRRLEALTKRARRSKSFLAAEAIAAFVEAESWQLDEIQTGMKELADGRGVPHEDVANWLRSWGESVSGRRLARDHRRVAASARAPSAPSLTHRARQSQGAPGLLRMARRTRRHGHRRRRAVDARGPRAGARVRREPPVHPVERPRN